MGSGINMFKEKEVFCRAVVSKKATRISRGRIVAFCIIAAPTLPISSFAQAPPTASQDPQIQEVIVTARKREEGLQDIS